MDKCFVPCGCDNREKVTKSDLDRYTDKIENVLSEEKGKKLFRNFMRTCKMSDGRLKLDMVEHIDQFINKNVENEEYALQCLLDEAQLIDELDAALMQKLFDAHSSENKEEMTEALKLLKTETIKVLETEYNAFRRRFTPSKSK